MFFLLFLRAKDTIFVTLNSTKAKKYKHKHYVKQNFKMCYAMYIYKKLNQPLRAVLEKVVKT